MKKRALLLIAVILCFSGSTCFGQNRSSLVIPFESSNNIVIVRASVNGSKPLSFVLDTGAGGSVVNARRAKDLGLKLEAEGEATTGDGSVEASIVKGAEISISGLKFPSLTLTAIDLSGLEAGMGRQVDGILGYEVFARHVVEFDYAIRTVRFYEPASFRYRGKGQTLPIAIDDNRPFIRGTVIQPGSEPAEGRFEFDTGQVSSVILGESFTTRNHLVPAGGKTIRISTGSILAGRSTAQTGRIEKLHLGGFIIRNPITNFVSGNRGEADTSDYAGQIGGEILRRFRVIVDYSRKHVVLEPNKHFAEPYEFDMSGLSLTSSGDNFRVFGVRALIENSPATEAGLLVGDVLTTIDKKPAAGMSLEQIRRMLRQPGRRFELGIKSGDRMMRINLKTRRMV